MLSKRFFGLLLGATILKLCRGQCHVVSTDLNTRWRAADVLEQNAHDYYQSLALGPDDVGDNQKRFVSVFSQALLLYVNNNKSNEILNVKDAAQKARKQLDNTADVVGGTYRALISIIFSIVEQPLTDEQEACPYNVYEPECKKALSLLRAERISRRPEYIKNINLYSRLRDWANSCGLQNVLDELASASAAGTDDDAIDFFTDSASVKYPATFQTFRGIYRTVRSVSYTCDAFSFL